MTINSILSSPFLLNIVIRALIVGVLVSLCSSLLGVSLVLKRYSMIGDGLSHVGFGALAIATALGLYPAYSLEVAIPIVIVAAFFILRLSENSKIKGDSAIALVSTSAIAIGIVIYDKTTGVTTDICTSLFGSNSINTINDKDMILSIILSVAVLVLFILFYNKIFAVTFDENFSQATGMSTSVYKMLISVLTAITIVLGMKMMGAIIISALIIFPSLTAMRVFRTFKSVVISSAIISIVCFIIGFCFATLGSMQPGPCIVLANLGAFLIFALIGAFPGIVSKLKRKESTK